MNWQSKWLTLDTPWDLNGPHPETERLMELLRSWQVPLENVFIPGCGRAHDAGVFLKYGLKVVGVDLAEAAIQVAKNLWNDTPGVDLIHASNEDFSKAHRGQFSLVFDRAMLCALAPEGRKNYVNGVLDSLAPGGIFSSFTFQKLNGEPKGPPYSINEQTMINLMSESFTLMGAFKVARPSPLPIVDQETLWIWKKAEI